MKQNSMPYIYDIHSPSKGGETMNEFATLKQKRLVSNAALVANVEYELAVACVGNYRGFQQAMVDILRFVSERSGKANATQANMLSNPDWHIQRKGCMEVLGKELWRQVQHSCGTSSTRVGTLAAYLLAED